MDDLEQFLRAAVVDSFEEAVQSKSIMRSYSPEDVLSLTMPVKIECVRCHHKVRRSLKFPYEWIHHLLDEDLGCECDCRVKEDPLASAEGDAVEQTVEKIMKRQNYINRILDLLVATGEPMSNKLIADKLGLAAWQSAAACGRLVEQGLVLRLKPGVFQIHKENAHIDHRVGIGIDVNTHHAVAADSVRDPLLAVPGPYVPMVDEELERLLAESDPPHASVSVKNFDDALEILDMLFPQGIKARQFPLVQQWMSITHQMIKEARS
jgi:hypothetical protein